MENDNSFEELMKKYTAELQLVPAGVRELYEGGATRLTVGSQIDLRSHHSKALSGFLDSKSNGYRESLKSAVTLATFLGGYYAAIGRSMKRAKAVQSCAKAIRQDGLDDATDLIDALWFMEEVWHGQIMKKLSELSNAGEVIVVEKKSSLSKWLFLAITIGALFYVFR